jgi:hypothetical protein
VPAPTISVEYFSRSRAAWIPATFEGFNEEYGTYTLDVQAFARPGDVRIAVGATAEYYSTSKGVWVAADVQGFNEEFGVYTLDVQPYARPEHVRLKGLQDPLQAPFCAASRVPEGSGVPEVLQSLPSESSSVQFPVGADVEYFSYRQGIWTPAIITGFDAETGSYQLDVRPSVLASNIRYPVPAEPGDVPQFTVDKYKVNGEVTGCSVFLQAENGNKILAFDESTIDFELACEAAPLQAWMDGIDLGMIPGLLTFLQSEASLRHEKLQTLKQEKDYYREKLDYTYFGLNEDSSDKDIDRAYRQASRELHPDKGGDEKAFAEMRQRYEEIKSMRQKDEEEAPVEKAEVQESDPLQWDPCDRTSMLKAHEAMRGFLIWVSNDLKTITGELEDLRVRFMADTKARRSLQDAGVAEDVLHSGDRKARRSLSDATTADDDLSSGKVSPPLEA